MKILLSTNNKKKYNEFKQIVSPLGIEIATPEILGLSLDVEETGSTFEENAALKSNALYSITKIPTLADDSGICVSHLNGAPGIYSARYGSTGLDDRGRAEYLMEAMENIENRKAYYVCCLAYTNSKGIFYVREECHGELTTEYDEEGTYGFGYDPIFYYPPLNSVFSRVLPEEKNIVSHRGKALKVFYENYKNGIYE